MAKIENSLTVNSFTNNQNNIDVIKYINNYPSFEQSILTIELNNLPTYTISEIQSLWFVVYKWNSEVEEVDSIPQLITTNLYKVINTGKGTYGVGGIQLTQDNLLFVSSTGLSLEDIENNPLTQVYTISDLEDFTVSEYINQLNPAFLFQDVNIAPRLIKVIELGNEADYLFLPPGGLYGQGELQTVIGDFQLLNSNQQNIAINPYIFSNEDLSLANRKGDILYGILDQYTGEELTLEKIISIPTGNSVDNIIYFQLGSELFQRVFTEYNIEWFGAVGDNSTDCTEQIQACINSCFYAGGGTILKQNKFYVIAGDLITSDNLGFNPNSQLYIPSAKDISISGGKTVVSIVFKGASTPTMNASGFTDDNIDLINQGSCFRSTLSYSETSGVLPSVIGIAGANTEIGYPFTVADVRFEDFWIRTPHDNVVGTYMTAFNMMKATFTTFRNCRADIDVAGWNTVEHQNMCIGIAPCGSNGGTTVVVDNCTSYGYYIGYTLGEHSYFSNVNVNFCNYGFDIAKAGHSSVILRALSQWNKTTMSFNKYDNSYPTLFHFINIYELTIENVSLGKWYDTITDIEDSTNGIMGNCFFTKTISGAGVFPNTPILKIGAEKLFTKHITEEIPTNETKQKVISGNITLNDSYNNCICKIKANSTITIPEGLKKNFNAVFDVWTGTATFVTSGTATINDDIGTTLTIGKMATLYQEELTNEFRLRGELS